MGSNDNSWKIREIIIRYAIRTNNVMDTCREFGISRTTYYKWLNQYKQQGVDGLKNKVPAKPKMPNQTLPKIEAQILEIVKKHSEYGPQRILYELEDRGITISYTGVYKVLKRNGLNSRKKREPYAKIELDAGTDHNRTSQQLNNKKAGESTFPGEMLLQGTFYLGRANSGGAFYQLVALDAYSGFAFSKIYIEKTTASVIDLMKTKVFPVFKELELDIKAVVTNAAKEYTTNFSSAKHRYEDFLKTENIIHYITTDPEQSNYKPLQKLQEELYNAVYAGFLNRSGKISLSEVNAALNHYIWYHNFEQKISKGTSVEKAPAEIIAAYKGEDFPMPLWMYIDTETVGG